MKQVYANGYLQQVTSPDGAVVYWQAMKENGRGQLTEFTLGTDITVQRSFDDKSGFLKEVESTYGAQGNVLQHMGFSFDPLGNLTSRRDYLANGGGGLIESFNYDDLNRLMESSIAGKIYGSLIMQYDDAGNIERKSDVGTYHYEGPRPHAVTRIEQNGTAISLTEQLITYTGFDKVQEITEGDAAISFTYGVNHERKITRTTFAGSVLTKRFIGGLYEEEENADGEVRRLHYIQAGGESIAIYTEEGGGSSLHYLLKDHLGSLSAVVDPQGNVVERYSYDAWGKRRDAETWDAFDGSASISYARGFTGHEHLELFSLVNMNGRVYDPVVGRFLSPDPYTQAPDYTQGLNRYSYVFNNPLSYTDPSGYITVGQFVGTAISVGLTIALTPVLGPGALVLGTFVGTLTGALIDGASFTDAAASAIQAGALAGVMGSITTGIGTAVEKAKVTWGRELIRAGAHGVFNGGVRAAMGGNFWHGFSSGAIGSLTGTLLQETNYVEGALLTAAAGGATEALSGGNFQDGAMTATMIYLMNHKQHAARDKMVRVQRQLNRIFDANQVPGGGDHSIVQHYLVFEGERVKGKRRVDGNLILYGIRDDGALLKLGQWAALSGSRTLLPIPNGVWTVSNFRRRLEKGFKKDGVGFSLDITPDPKFGRGKLRIHSDGNKVGTAGCIGLTCSGPLLSGFVVQIQEALRANDGQIPLFVRGSYSSLDAVTIGPR